MKKSFILLIPFLVILGTFFNSCVDDTFDEPEISFKDPDIATNTTIKEIKSMLGGANHFEITEDLVFSAIVIANDSTGNFYKKIVVQDNTGGIEILIDGRNMYGKYPVGRKIFVKAQGLALAQSKGVIRMGRVFSNGSLVEIPFKEVEKFITGGSLNNVVEPKIRTFSQISDDDISTLVKFDNVQFEEPGTTFANGTLKIDENRTLVDCNGGSFIIRTSGYAVFANDTIPSLNGSLLCVVGKYKDTYQGYIRSLKDIDFKNERCGTNPGGGLFSDDFEEGLDKWNAVNVKGEQVWQHSDKYGNPGGCAKISGYQSGPHENEDWLITPGIDLSGSGAHSLTFDNATKYNGNPMEVYISTDYAGSGLPSAATWTQLSYQRSGGNWEWVSSGIIDLGAYAGKKVYIAFKYTSTDSAAATWEIDNVVIK